MTTDSSGEESSDDQPPLGEEWETNWPDQMGSQQRVESVAETIRQPRSAQWIAERAAVSPKTARKYLTQLVENGDMTTEHSDSTRATLYAPSPDRTMIDHVIELADRSTEELTELRIEIADEIESWQTKYGVESPTELRQTIDESINADERRRRKQIAHRWESRAHLQSMINVALAFQDHKDRFSQFVETQTDDVSTTDLKG